ncbi:MAG: MBL fold metallo-hydrolase, partial [Syntrophomonadaceae bacterium]|nr:MBL fold metallo-hydrolase [Syntrophomonadaceae bacterium]
MFNDRCVMVGQEEISFFEDAEKFLRSNGYFRWPELMGEEKEVVWERSTNSAEENPEVLALFGPPAIAINSCFHDGQIFDSGHVKFQAVHLPGHSPGHYGFYFPEEGLLFSADYDFAPFGPWYGGEYCSYGQVLQSMQRIVDIQPRVLFGSHRRKVFDEVGANVKAYMSLPLRREAAIMAALERPMSFKQLCGDESVRMPLSGDPHEVFWDRMMLLKQLEYYTEAGVLWLNEDGFYEKN